MRRWLVLLVVALLVMPSVVRSQATPETLPSFDEALASADAYPIAIASDQFSGARAAKNGLYWLTFIAMRFTSEESASRALPVPVDYYSAEQAALGTSDTVRVSPVGDERLALLVESDPFDYAYISVRVGAVVFFGYTYGDGVNVIAELLPYIETSIERIQSTDPQTSDDLLAVIPAFNEMPAGFNEWGSIDTSYEPIPTPTPIAQTDPSGFMASGTGDTSNHVVVSPGTYRVTFTCDSPGGSANLFSPASFDPTDIPSSGIALTFTDFDETVRGLLSVKCDGNWTLEGVAM